MSFSKWKFMFPLILLYSCGYGNFDFKNVSTSDVKLKTSCSNDYLVAKSATVNLKKGTTLFHLNRALPRCSNSLKMHTWKQVSALADDERYAIGLITELACNIDITAGDSSNYVAFYYNEALGVSGWKNNMSVKIIYLYHLNSNLFTEIRLLGYE